MRLRLRACVMMQIPWERMTCRKVELLMIVVLFVHFLRYAGNAMLHAIQLSLMGMRMARKIVIIVV